MRKACFVILSFFLAFPCSAAIIAIDADMFAEGADISAGFDGITLSSVGGYPGLDGRVYAFGDGLASTGTKVFGNNLSFQRQWYADLTNGFALRADFLKLADSVSIDIIGDDYSGMDVGVLYAYNAADVLLDTIVTAQLGYGQVFNAQISRPAFDIAYIISGGWSQSEDTVHLDNLRVNCLPEPATVLLLGLGGIFISRRFFHRQDAKI
jgi:hypothetical protein